MLNEFKDVRPHPTVSEVTLIDGKPFFPISWLNKQSYCEYQIFLENMKHVDVEATPVMLAGKEKHEELEKEHKEKATEKMSLGDANKKSEEEKVVLIFREVFVYGKGSYIKGKIDELVFTPEFIKVIDDKSGEKAWLPDKKQVRAYCLALKENYNINKKIVGVLRNSDTKEVIWEEEFTDSVKDDIMESIQRVHDLIAGNREFEPTKNPNKCRSCRFFQQNICDRAVTS